MVISISGLSGSGKSTLTKYLSQNLNWPSIYVGKYFRDLAKIKCLTIYEISSLALQDSNIDNKITKEVLAEINKYKNCIRDALGAGFIAKEHEKICVFLYCPLSIRTKRISERTGKDYSYIKKRISKLDDETISRFKKAYNYNLLDLNNYDIIINTRKIKVNQILPLIKELIGGYHE